MGVSKVFLAALLLSLTVSVVNAYTIVMRDGRRVEIPNEFRVTDSTLTYDVGNGFQITMQLNTVDIAATERANGETQGSFLTKTRKPQVEVVPQTRQSSAQRSITNADLEKYRRVRVESEKEYESYRKELGLPSKEERRLEVEAIDDRTLEQVRRMRAQEEAYWRSRADALRAEMAATGNQTQSVPASPDGITWPNSYGVFPGFSGFDSAGFGVAGAPFRGFRRFPSTPFSGFLATPITPFPTFPFIPVSRGRGRPPVFGAPGIRFNSRPIHGRPGRHR